MTQLDIFNTIRVARILVHVFEKLKAKENRQGKRLVMVETARFGVSL